MKLRDYQERLLADASRLMRAGTRSVIIQASTGAGKTATAAAMLKRAMARGKRSWFVVHRSELVEQCSAAFSLQNIPHGYIAAGYPVDRKQPIQIGMIQSINRRPNEEAPDFIVWDECHHAASKTYERVRARFPAAYHIGLTATPERLDGRGLGRYFDAMVQAPSMRELIDAGYLADYRLFAPGMPVLLGVKQQAGDYERGALSAVMDKPRITGDAIQHYQRLCPGARAIASCASIQHSQHVAASFVAAGVPALHVDGETPKPERLAAMRAFREGRCLVLCNVDLFGEGVDVPDAVAAILLRPTQSLALHLQQCGRVLRVKADGGRAIILDHAGNTRRHGLPDDDREWQLADREARKPKAKDPEAGVRVCPSCFAANRVGVPACQECGHRFEVKPRKVETVNGQLAEVDKEAARKVLHLERANAKSLEDLRALGARRGYRAGWAEYVWKARQARRRHEA